MNSQNGMKHEAINLGEFFLNKMAADRDMLWSRSLHLISSVKYISSTDGSGLRDH